MKISLIFDFTVREDLRRGECDGDAAKWRRRPGTAAEKERVAELVLAGRKGEAMVRRMEGFEGNDGRKEERE